MNILQSITAFFASIIIFICVSLDIPCYPMGQKVDMDKFTETFTEEFDGELNRNVWSGHYQYGNTTEARKGSYWNQYLAKTENGKLIIPVTYLEEGMGGKGAGWYSAGIDTDSDSPDGFSQKFGYFECRCILPKGADIWSAFWLMNDGVYEADGSGKDGTEIDIFESYDVNGGNINHAIHYDGYGEYHQSVGCTTTNKNLYDGNYHTFALLWNDDGYYFYTDGEMVNKIDKSQANFPGSSTVPSYLKITAEFGSWGGYISKATLPDALVVDYVKVYKEIQ